MREGPLLILPSRPSFGKSVEIFVSQSVWPKDVITTGREADATVVLSTDEILWSKQGKQFQLLHC
jgi:hypothetical protein